MSLHALPLSVCNTMSCYYSTLLLCAVIAAVAATSNSFDPRKIAQALHRVRRDAENQGCWKRLDAIFCDEDYQNAVEEEIKQSNCKNIFYSFPDNRDYIYYDYDGGKEVLCSRPLDERQNVPNCTEVCSYRQLYYNYCTQLGQQYAQISRECGLFNGTDSELLAYCWVDKGDFCFLKQNLTLPLIEKCVVQSSNGTAPEVRCSGDCRRVVNELIEQGGCCVSLFNSDELVDYEDHYYYDYDDLPTVSDALSACGVKVPDPCTDVSPPRELLQCARDPAAGSSVILSSPVLMLVVVIINLGLFLSY